MPFPRIKGNAYEYSNHMPLRSCGKRNKKSGRVVEDYISFIDFAPSILEAAGIREEESGMQPLEGRSFTSIFSSIKKDR